MEPFELEVRIGEGLQTFRCALQNWGYSYRILVYLDERTIIFEPDEERRFRALVQPEDQQQAAVSPAVLAAIAEELERALK